MDGSNDAALSADGGKSTFFGDLSRERRMGMKILVVDDEKDIVDLLSINLEQEGYKVIPAYSGEEALELVRGKKPDLMILDLMLPGVQGLEVCRQVRADPDHASMAIVILSAKDAEVDRVLGLEIGADDYVVKPFSMRELTARVRAALRRTAGQRSRDSKEGKFSHKGLLVDFTKLKWLWQAGK
jgi:DNA-binding response OmpR family regulator